MPTIRRRLSVSSGPIGRGLDRIRAEFELPDGFPVAVDDEVAELASRAEGRFDSVSGAAARLDATHLPLLAVDPEGARDLDQAFHIERSGGGYLLHYCIADVGALVRPGGAVDQEARRRGVTVYLPGTKVPLHPPALSEGIGSLLDDGRPRPALWWRLEFDDSGESADARVDRAMVRCSEAISYVEAQRRIDAGDNGALGLLAELGPLRQRVERDRGGVSLELPEQEIDVSDDGTVNLNLSVPLPVEEWNAQMSLATGMAAAAMMLDGEVGILRTMPPPDDATLAEMRSASEALGVKWPTSIAYPEWVRAIDASTPVGAALMNLAAKGLRGAGYTSFNGAQPALSTHAAVAAPYAHVTAPLRRLVDRFGNEIVLALSAGQRPPAWVLEGLEGLPELMATADRFAKKVDRAAVDLVEAAILGGLTGQVVSGVVVGDSKAGAIVQILDPPSVVPVRKLRERAGESVRLQVVSADLAARTVTFRPASDVVGGNVSIEQRAGTSASGPAASGMPASGMPGS